MKIKLIHILNNIDGDREQKSIKSLSKLSDYGVEYIQQITPLYDNNVPIESKIYKTSGKGFYGLYQNYTKAILEHLNGDIDGIIICECDAILNIKSEDFTTEINRTISFCKKHDIYQFSWGSYIQNNISQSNIIKYDDNYQNYIIVDNIIQSHFNFFPIKSMNFFNKVIKTQQWETIDVWFNLIFSKYFISDNIFKQATVINSLSYQSDGKSLLDGNIRKLDNYKPINNIKNNNNFIINYNKNENKILISTQSTIDVLFKLYLLNNIIHDFEIIYINNLQFNNNKLWVIPSKKLNGVYKIELLYNNILIKEYYNINLQ